MILCVATLLIASPKIKEVWITAEGFRCALSYERDRSLTIKK